MEIMDTTLRDGEQMSDVAFSPEIKLKLAEMLFEVGVNRIEVASARSVKYDELAVKNIYKMAEKRNRLEDVEVLGFLDNGISVNWIYDKGGKTINLLTKGSKKHCNEGLKKTLEEHLNDIEIEVNYAYNKNMKVNVYLEDWSNGMIDSPEYVMKLVEELKNLKVKRIMLPDTVGVLSPWLTEEYINMMLNVFPNLHFDFHAHNDYDLATANNLAAMKNKIYGIHVTLNGLGERSGNSSLYPIAIAAKDFLNYELGLDEKQFYNLSKFVESITNMRLQPNTSIVGENAHIQTAGIHASGDKKGNLYASKITAKRIGKQETEYALGKQSGVSTIEMNLKQMGIELDKYKLKDLTEKVRELGSKGKTVTKGDLYFLVNDCADYPQEVPFKFLDAKIEVNLNGSRSSYIKVKLYDQILENSAVGDGGYDSMMNAIKGLLTEQNIELPKLVDYHPIIPPGGKSDALVKTSILWENEKRFTTFGIDSDQTISAIEATEKMINLVLMKY